ncbi:transcription initiation factor TFIID subunit 10-like [Myiozetetes cayanensis]|uniref:transcription initiation factor TFIID subunit 10-like n=1 Tax=Myiozetetes cayanensis TaxID=478635 RepID=UPI00216065AA|nr:transcription initiation factor TFIID subunit 10-like [Myiozetetes cayanensis]
MFKKDGKRDSRKVRGAKQRPRTNDSTNADPVPTAAPPPAPAKGSKPNPAAAGSAAPGAAPGRGVGTAQGAEGGAVGERGSVPLSVTAPPDGTTSNGMYVPPAANGDMKPAVSTTAFVDFLMQLEDHTPMIPDAVTERLGAAWSRSRLRAENQATEQACAGGVT